MIKKIKFNKINDNYVSKYEYKVINNDTLEIINTGYIENTNKGPTIHQKTLEYQYNNIYFIDEHIYYNDFYNISVYIGDKLINQENIEYDTKTKCFYINNHINIINNVNNVNYINNINDININNINNTNNIKNTNNINNINVVYYKNIIEYEVDIPDNCKIVVTPVIKNKQYIGNHNILY